MTDDWRLVAITSWYRTEMNIVTKEVRYIKLY